MRHSDDALAQDPGGNLPAAISPSGSEAGLRRPSSLTFWQGTALALLGGAVLFGACQGDNLFSGNSESAQPRIVGIAAPAQVFPGDTVVVQVSAYGARQITSLGVQLAGAVTFDTTISVTAATTVATTLRVPLLGFLSDTMLIIHAVAYDKAGAVSRMRSDTIKAVAPPAVVEVSGPDSVRPGSAMTFAVRALGVRPITKIRFALHGAISRVDSIMVTQPRKDVSESITFPVAVTDVVDTSLVVDVQAVDNTGLEGFITRGTMPVAIPVPVIMLLTAPDTVRAGGSLDVSVDARGLRNLTRLAFSLRGAVTRDSAVSIAIPAHSITQSASFLIPADAQDSVIRLSVSAIDGAGKVSLPSIKNVAIPTGIPVVDSLIVGDSIRPGTILDARVFAHGARPLSRIDLSLRGAVNKDYNAVPTPMRPNVTQDFALPIPDTTADSLLVVMAKATDTGGNVSRIVQKVVRVSDTALPTVVATLVSTTVPAGASAIIRIQASDNVGLSRVGVRILDATKLQVAGDSANVTGRTRDSTFSVLIPASGPRTLSVIGYARDMSNHEARSPVLNLVVVDSTLPLNVIVAPADSATASLRDSLAVTVHAASIVGVRSISLSGFAVRQPPNSDATIVTRYAPRTVTFPQAPAANMPVDVTTTRFLVPLPDTTSEVVTIQSVVTDSLGKTTKAQIVVVMGGPIIHLISPANGLRVGPSAFIPVSLDASEPTNGLDRVVVTITSTGAASAPTSLNYLNLGGQRTLFTNPAGTTITAPATAADLVFRATAFNTLGFSSTVVDTVHVVSAAVADTFAPSVRIVSIDSMRARLTQRLEQTDSIGVTVAAADSGVAGVQTMGITVVAKDSLGAILGQQFVEASFAPATVPAPLKFYFTPSMFAGLSPTLPANLFPKLVNFEVTAYAIDASPGAYCSASVLTSMMRAPCDLATLPGVRLAQGRTGWQNRLRVVAGHTIRLPQPTPADSAVIADVVPDTTGAGRLYISDIHNNIVQRYQMGTGQFDAGGIRAGSQPWGLDWVQATNTLIVANSGGTNISRIDVSGPNPQDVAATRVLTPNMVLEQWEKKPDPTSGTLVWVILPALDFSDRPQFIAQDSKGRLLYSTVPTPSATDGTLRIVQKDAGWTQSETWLLNQEYGWVSDTTGFAFSNFDNVGATGPGDILSLTYHTPGNPAAQFTVTNTLKNLCQPGGIISGLRATGATIAFCATGHWDRAKIGLGDTTFVAIAGDRSHVAFGEGAIAPTGRIFMWNSTTNVISPDIAVVDLVNNASERVVGLGLNTNGTFAVARGRLASYFFTPDLRLQGQYSPVAAGTGGAGLHPLHNSAAGPASILVSFVGDMDGPRPIVRIIDTFNFAEVGRLYVHDQITGQIRVSLAPATEPNKCGPAPAAASTCIFARLYAVTSSGTVAIVDVQRRDINMP